MTREERMNLDRCRNDTQRNHIRYIEKWGVSIISVAPNAEDSMPAWTYSIGFWQQYEHPEVIIIGLDGETAGEMINEINRRVRDDGDRFTGGVSADDLLSGGYVCYFEPVDQLDYGDWLRGNNWFYGDDSFQAVQVLWPDMKGVYPWQQNASASFKRVQPVLSSLPRRGMQ